MPRRPRLIVPGVPLHIIQRGNNRSVCFFADEDYHLYLDILAERAEVHGCAVHAWCLMTNHVHLLVTPTTEEGAAQMMKGLGQRYVQHVNRTCRRTGTLWEGRFRSCLLDADAYVLACARYIELNPVRAGMVEHPAEYRWSSYRANAQEEADTLVTPHALYQALGATAAERAAAYRALFQDVLPAELVEQIRAATNGNFALGHPRFQAEIAAALGRRVVPGKPGRPVAEA